MADSPEKGGDGVLKLTVFCNGAALNDAIRIVSVVVDKAINVIPTAKLTLLDGDMPEKDFPISNTKDFIPGSVIKINAGYQDVETTIFEGVVVKQSMKITGDNYSRLIIECKDKAMAMTLGRKNANFVDSKDSDIITGLIGNYAGLSADVHASTTVHAELVQYYSSDWDFMLARAEVCGLLVIVEAGKVSVTAPEVSAAAVLKVTYGQDLMEFNAEIDARHQFAEVKGASWDPATQKVVEEARPVKTLNAQGNLTSKDLAKVFNLSSFKLQTPVIMEKTALKDWADSQQLKSGLARIRGSMKFQGNAKAKLGTIIDLEGVGARFSGSVYVSAVQHVIEDGNWLTEVDFGMSPEWFAERRDLVTPPASGLLPGVEGLHIGVVKKLDADPASLNRIQVSVPVLQADTEGVWARLSNYYASNGFGEFFIPEIGDEVILGYLNNDPGHPVILGSLYSSKLKPPYELTADNFIKAIVTRSKLKVEFDDEKKVITVITPAENKIIISDDDKSIEISDQNKNKIKLSSSGIDMESPKDISITAKGKITIDATGELSMSSKADVKVKGLNVSNTADVAYTAKGSASAEISASGTTTVKGAMVMIN